MADGNLIELANRLSGKAMISSEITEDDVKSVDMESLIAHIIGRFENKDGMKILDKKELRLALAGMAEKKEPVQIEVIRSSDFKPQAKDIGAKYSIRNTRIERSNNTVGDFVDYFKDRFSKLRDIMKSYGGAGGTVSISAIKQYISGREVGVIGMVYERTVTKNGHVMMTLEDETGTAKVLVYKPQIKEKKAIDLFDTASKVVKDDIIYIKGKVSGPFFIANTISWPGMPVRVRRRSDEDVAIALLSDVHIGNKLFLDKQFAKFIEWLNGGVDNRKDLANKIKYVVVGGDLVDGVGVYPGQDKELSIPDIYEQYSVFFDYMEKVPEYVEVFVLPGNHDAVQRAEPQPQINKKLLGGFERPNIHVVANPCYLNLHGVKVLSYHGASLDSVIQNIAGCSYSNATSAMKEIAKRRHLSPIYGNNVITPCKNDALVIDEVPDVLHMGHIHKNGYEEFHGTALVNSGTWQARTSFLVKQGHIPTPALLSVYEARTTSMAFVDFNG
ncbi:DNA polymerase II small subunit [uncultured archaeon]|nr:DNA polymerase II small subunit [uncultured archaeon]